VVEKENLNELSHDLFQFIIGLDLDPAQYKITIDLLKRKGLSDDQIKQFLQQEAK